MGETGGRKPVVLVVDDEPAVISVLCYALRSHGFGVRQAADGQEALSVYRQHGPDIDLVLLDVRMPGMDGPQTLRALRDLDPDVRCCFMSGYAGGDDEAELLRLGAARVLAKPFRLEGVAAALREVLGGGSAGVP
jgi:CheY-like chemotaxis protein